MVDTAQDLINRAAQMYYQGPISEPRNEMILVLMAALDVEHKARVKAERELFAATLLLGQRAVAAEVSRG